MPKDAQMVWLFNYPTSSGQRWRLLRRVADDVQRDTHWLLGGLAVQKTQTRDNQKTKARYCYHKGSQASKTKEPVIRYLIQTSALWNHFHL